MSSKRWYALFLAVAMIGCGDDDGTIEVDGGSDAGDTDGGMMMMPDVPPGMCADARTVALTTGEQQLTGDTTDATATRTLGEGCGDTPTGQELLALTIPGSGEVGVSFSLINDGTDFDTTVEFRPAGCDDVTDAICFDDESLFEVRSAGSFIANGGDTVYLIVTGYDAENSGPWAMDVTVTANIEAPVLTGGTALRVDDTRLDLALDGTDANGDATGFVISFLATGGTVIPVDTDGDAETPAEEELFFGFQNDVAGETTFTGLARLNGLDQLPELADAVQVRIALFDAFELISSAMTLDLVDVTESGLEGPCVDGESVCGDAFECVEAVCVIPDDAVAACEAATAVALTAGTPSVQTASIAAGEGALTASCGDTFGDEALYRVTVPAGAFDLVATTVRAANDVESVDTVVYIQSFCGDPGTEGETGCNDDIGDEDFRSTVTLLDVEAGTYTVGAELWGGSEEAATVELAITLRPVLEAGASCDLTEVANRCGAGTCSGEPATCVVE